MVASRPSRRIVLLAPLAGALSGCGPSGPIEVPALALPGLPGLTRHGWPVPGFSERDFVGRVSVLNVWASWCPYCRGEHDHLMRLSQDRRFALVGLLHQDKPEPALAYLKQAGNPFAALAIEGGALARTLRQRGVPATYVVDRRARVREAIRGALDEDSIRTRLLPAVEAALAGPGTA